MDFSNVLTTGETFHSRILRMKGYALDDDTILDDGCWRAM